MLTSIVKATRAHYAALQHRPSHDRVRLNYRVTSMAGVVTGSIHVKASTRGRRRGEITRLMNRLHAMYPEARSIACAYEEAI
jgi:hypothetical protein